MSLMAQKKGYRSIWFIQTMGVSSRWSPRFVARFAHERLDLGITSKLDNDRYREARVRELKLVARACPFDRILDDAGR